MDLKEISELLKEIEERGHNGIVQISMHCERKHSPNKICACCTYIDFDFLPIIRTLVKRVKEVKEAEEVIKSFQFREECMLELVKAGKKMVLEYHEKWGENVHEK